MGRATSERRRSGGRRKGRDLLAIVLLPAWCGASSAQVTDPEDRKLRLHFEESPPRERALQPATFREPGEEAPPPGAPGGTGPGEAAPFGGREEPEKPAPLRGVYDKPFLGSLWRRAYLGGYTEFEYHAFQDGVLGLPRGFRAHRTNLFAYAEVSDQVHFGSEIEFENEAPGEELEVKVEMAFVDWMLYQELAIRAGAILAPLGRVNVNHDGPVRELTDRPLVSTFVIPTTLTEAGVGIHGTLRPHDALALHYQVYGTNGFRILDRDGALAAPFTDREQLLREGRPSPGGDFNKDLASMGRVAAQVLEALEVGGSWHVGTYDERSRNLLALLAADFAAVKGPFAIEGEIARAGFERDAFARAAGVPDRFWGFYVQASASHMPRALKRAAPRIFDNQGSTFTVVLRYDQVDLDGDRGEALEPGLNFRPSADTVFKFSYRLGFKSLGIRDVPGREGFDDDGFVFSLASYF